MDMAIDKQDTESAISFHLTDRDPPKEVLRVERDGRFFVDGQEIETSEQVRDIFARWCRQVSGGPNLVAAARDMVRECQEIDFTDRPSVAQALDQLQEAVKPE